MNEICPAPVHEYASRFTSADTPLLAELAAFTRKTHPQAHMLSGEIQGQFLTQISRMIQPRAILEVGTFTGYGALCLAPGLTESGELHTIECRSEDAATARQFFNRSLYRQQLFLHEGLAAEIIPTINHEWDLVFLDADKTGYIDYYELILPRMRPGAWLLADNVLFHGQVLEEPLRGKNAKAVHAFNEHVQQDNRTEQVLLTIRDGILLIRKK